MKVSDVDRILTALGNHISWHGANNDDVCSLGGP